MFRLNKLADYGSVIMAYLAVCPNQYFSAKSLAKSTRIGLPTVSKILKLLTKAGLLKSLRGVKGGYQLARSAASINIAEVVLAVEQELAVTDCSHGSGECLLEPYCAIRNQWQLISQTIVQALRSISLADMIKPLSREQMQQHVSLVKTLTQQKSGVEL